MLFLFWQMLKEKVKCRKSASHLSVMACFFNQLAGSCKNDLNVYKMINLFYGCKRYLIGRILKVPPVNPQTYIFSVL